jgi:hypothetical protein
MLARIYTRSPKHHAATQHYFEVAVLSSQLSSHSSSPFPSHCGPRRLENLCSSIWTPRNFGYCGLLCGLLLVLYCFILIISTVMFALLLLFHSSFPKHRCRTIETQFANDVCSNDVATPGGGGSAQHVKCHRYQQRR